MLAYDHQIQRFGTDSYLLTWRSSRSNSQSTSEPCNAATLDRTLAEKVCVLYGLDFPAESINKRQRSSRGLGWFRSR